MVTDAETTSITVLTAALSEISQKHWASITKAPSYMQLLSYTLLGEPVLHPGLNFWLVGYYQ